MHACDLLQYCQIYTVQSTLVARTLFAHYSLWLNKLRGHKISYRYGHNILIVCAAILIDCNIMYGRNRTINEFLLLLNLLNKELH
jgi:hypothetical protein